MNDELAEAERNRRLNARIAAGTAVMGIDEVMDLVRQMAAANMDVPGPRAVQIADELVKAQARVDLLRQANARLYEALGELVEAPLRSPEHEDRARAVLASMTTELAGWQTS